MRGRSARCAAARSVRRPMLRACRGASQRGRRRVTGSTARRAVGDDADPAARATRRRACSRPTASRRCRKCVSVPSGARPMMRPAASDAAPDAELLHRRVEAHEAAAQPRRDAAGDERHRRAEAAGHEHEEQHRQRHDPRERQRRQMRRDDRIGAIEIEREDREHALLAVAVGEPADHLRGDERRRAAGEIDDGEVALRRRRRWRRCRRR